ncbi:MAG: Crp/Fnr family transcriptional regulator [Chloroflexi bacterium]|nr:Crp/Fnr family transcriptional regulator [Chloroflexota bacterium]
MRDSRARPAGPHPDAGAVKRRYLQQVEVFQDLSETQIYEVERSTRMSTVGPGRILHQPDEKSEMLFLLKSGRVQIYRISPDGKRFIVSNIEPGMFFGEMALLGQAMHDSFAEAVTDSTVCVISRRDLEYLIGRFPTIGVRIMQALADRLSEAESQLEDLALKSLTARLATLILRLSSGANGRVAGLTHNDLAERVGTSRETATQALNELKNAGLIAIGRKRIDVLDRQGLEDVAEAY